jgi:hypothetical protein
MMANEGGPKQALPVHDRSGFSRRQRRAESLLGRQRDGAKSPPRRCSNGRRSRATRLRLAVEALER